MMNMKLVVIALCIMCANGQEDIRYIYMCRWLDIASRITICTECPDCYACLTDVTGQDNAKCLSEDVTTVLECASQIKYMFRPSPEASRTRYPCSSQCSTCLLDLANPQLNFPSLREIETPVWMSIYGNLFERSSRSIELNSETPREPQQFPLRQKRGVDDDGDACCGTQRETLPFLENVTDDYGDTWHPVWFTHYNYFYGSLHYMYQYHDVITCPISHSTCDSDYRCVVHNAPRTFLMASYPPNPTHGYFFFIIVHPYFTQFRTLDMPSYCKCTL